jgi:hypothetical protein
MATALEQLKKIDAERSALLAGAKEEALGRLKAVVEELNQMGFSYSIVADGGKKAARVAGPKSTKGAITEKECPICGFQTHPAHDARKHRSQGERKRAFSEKQLHEAGLVKVA